MTTDRSRVKRHPERGAYDRETIDAILDEAIYCTVGFVDEGLPVVVPTIHVRVGDEIILHGSPASRMLRVLATGVDAAINVTLLDGMVLARSVFNHSMNYRSATVFGRGRLITDTDEKLEAMRVFTEKVLPGRWDDARQPSRNEFAGTHMVGFPIDEASAKQRFGPPTDEDDDYDLPVWAGVVPYSLVAGTPIPDDRLHPGIEFPDYLSSLFD